MKDAEPENDYSGIFCTEKEIRDQQKDEETISYCVIFDGIQESKDGRQLAQFTDMATKSSFLVEINNCVLCKLTVTRVLYGRHSFGQH
jgi:hypothetical protein